MEKLSLRKQQEKTLSADIERVLSYRKWINAKTNNNFDTTRMLGVVATGKGAENYLPNTIPKLIKQISEIRIGADIIIGLNNGFECQNVIESFTLLPNVQVIHLYTDKKVASTSPAKIFDNLNCQGNPYRLSKVDLQRSRHRIFVVHQKEGPYSAGKIRVLGDIYESLFLDSIDNGWIPPAILLTFDAESQFLVNRDYTIIAPDSNGLIPIIDELKNNPEIDLLGANNRYVVYRKNMVDGIEVLLPNFEAELPPVHWFLNIVHGKYRGYKWKPGGGTVGKTDVIISLLTLIAQRYPGARIEDVQLTILAKHAGFQGDIFMDTVSTNRVPSLTDLTGDQNPESAWIEQVFRWIASAYALEEKYGKHKVRYFNNAIGFPWSVWIDIRFFKRIMEIEKLNFLQVLLKKSKVLIAALFFFIKIRKKASENPDILQGSGAKASW